MLPRWVAMTTSSRHPLARSKNRQAHVATALPQGEAVRRNNKNRQAQHNGRRWRSKAPDASDEENADPLRLSEDWGIDSPEAGFDFAEKGARLAPGGHGHWVLLEPEVEPPPPRVEAKALRHVVPQRDEMLRRRRVRLGGSDTAADEVHRSEQPIMRAKLSLSELAREQRQFQALSNSLTQMKSGGRPSIESMAEAWERARQPDRKVADGGLGRSRSTAKRSSVMRMGPTDASYRRCGGGALREKRPVRLRPLSQPSDPHNAEARAAARKSRVRSRSAPVLPDDGKDCLDSTGYAQRVRSIELQAL